MSDIPATSQRPAYSDWLKQHSEALAVITLTLYFTLRLVFLALNVHPYIPPDEVTHFGRCLLFSRSFLPPTDSNQTYELGLISHIPTLYYVTMGRLLTVNVVGLSDLAYLRLANVGLGIATVAFAYRWIRLTVLNRLARVLFLVMLTNTLMLTGLFASVSYDNLTNLLATMALYYLFAFFHGRRPDTLANFAICCLAGALTKITFLPLIVALFLILIVRERNSLTSFPLTVVSSIRQAQLGTLVRYACVVVAATLVVWLYGGNYLKYGKLSPNAGQVLGLEDAMKYRIFARNYIANLYKSDRLSYEEAIKMTENIDHPGDRRTARRLIEIAKHAKRISTRPLGPVAYSVVWTFQMVRGCFCYMGHRIIYKTFAETIGYVVLLLVSLFCFLTKWCPNQANAEMTCAAVVVCFYLLALMWYVHYPIYLRSGDISLAVQSRYLFPVLVPLYGLIVNYLFSGTPGRFQGSVAFAVSIYFVWGDFPWFLIHATREWFMP